MKKRFILLVFGLFVFLGSVSAAIYYVDYDNGQDSNTGTSTSSPLKHCPGDGNYAPSGSAPTLLSPGDVVIFKGGVVYYTTTSPGIRLSWSGNGDSDANRIIYDGDSGKYAPRWGSGTAKAIIDGSGVTNFGIFGLYSSNRQYITINNFELHNAMNSYDTNYGWHGLIINYGTPANYITISNNLMYDAGYYELDQPNSGKCIQLNGNHNKIHDNYLYDCYLMGIAVRTSLEGGGYNEIYNNFITGVDRWALNLIADRTSIGDKVYNNTLKNVGKGDISYSGGVHSNWMYIFSTKDTYPGSVGAYQDLEIYNNLFYNDYSPTESWGAGFIQIGGGEPSGGIWNGLYIFNNVFFDGSAGQPGIGFAAGRDLSPTSCASPPCGITLNNTYILGNSFWNGPDSSAGTLWLNLGLYPFSNNPSNLHIQNNIVVSEKSGTIINIPYRSNVTGDYLVSHNSYYNAASRPFENSIAEWSSHDPYIPPILTYYYWDTYSPGWKANGFDSIGSFGPVSNPLYVSTVYSSPDLRLQESSPLINNGIDLSALCLNVPALCYDKNGVPRSQGSGWDIGAYEYISGGAYCDDGTCDAGETCFQDSCCNGLVYNLGTQVCCSATIYTGDCCLTSDCLVGESCVSHVCTSTSSCGDADKDRNGIVTMTELIDFILDWKSGIVTMTQLMNGISEWKNGC